MQTSVATKQALPQPDDKKVLALQQRAPELMTTWAASTASPPLRSTSLNTIAASLSSPPAPPLQNNCSRVPTLPGYTISVEASSPSLFSIEFPVERFFGHLPVSVMMKHEWRRDTEEAQFAFVLLPKVSYATGFSAIVNLPPRSQHRPWVVWGQKTIRDTCLDFKLRHHPHAANNIRMPNDELCRLWDALLKRKDILFVMYDLRDHVLCFDEEPPLPGSTLATMGSPHINSNPNDYSYFPRPHPEDLCVPAKYTLTFRGMAENRGWAGCASVRPDLQRAMSNWMLPGVAIEFKKEPYNDSDKKRYKELVTHTDFGLFLHGWGRWAYRLTELMRICIIPVILANGRTLPFANLIDWSKASVRVDEALTRDPAAIVAKLPTDRTVITSMRRYVSEVYDKYMSTPEKQFHALLLDLKLFLRKGHPPGTGSGNLGS
eukprot:TRINITY_DN102016_c0_g1_i1.p1 TRINITY_DN102016_c0_g1~~TRINITY_DN102016_c0_g1_i1.p1  ORF type:complete len:476 (-),score=65.59 TRINITY_DN102016_c0_g1_i1:29-1324(-)